MSRFLVLAWSFLGALAPIPAAQDPPAPTVAAKPQDPEISPASLQARIDAVKANESIAPELRNALLEVYGKALEAAKAAEAYAAARQRYLEAREQAPDKLARRRSELEALESLRPGPPRSDLPLAELEQGLAAAQQAQATAARQGSELEKERTRRAERRNAATALLAELRHRLDELPNQPAETPDADPRLQTARRLALAAERARLQAEVEALPAELQAYAAEEELLRTELDLAARRASKAKDDADAWQVVLQQQRADEAARAARQAEEQLLQADPRLIALAAGNAELAKASAQLTPQLEQAERDKAERSADLQRLQQDFDEVRKRVEIVGETEAIGAMLRQRRVQLGDAGRNVQQRSRNLRELIADAQLKSFEFEERRRRLIEDPERWLQQELGATALDQLPPALLVEARRLRDARRQLLRQLTDDYSRLIQNLADLESADLQLVRLVASYRSFVTERVLGIRSSEPLWRLDFRATGRALAWLTDSKQWRDLGALLLDGLLQDKWPLVLLLPLLLLTALRHLWSRRLAAHGERALRGNNIAYAPTAAAAVDTLSLAAPPLLFWILAWRLTAHPDATEFAKAMAVGASRGAASLLLVALLSALVHSKGLAEAHFLWQTTTLSLLRRSQSLLFAGALLSFPVGALEATGEDAWLGSLGAIFTAVQLGFLVVVFARLWHPGRGILAGGVRAAGSTLHRFRRLIALLAIGTPLLLLAMTVLGYEYTAIQLARRLELTAAVLLAGVLVHAMVLRALVLERRRLQIRQAQERMQAAKSGEAQATLAELSPLADIDPQSLARQTQALVRGALSVAVLLAMYHIWADELPALGFLENIRLWTDSSGADAVIITLADLLLSILVLLMTLAAVRNVPALLELLLLQRMQMGAGERNAIATLAKYGIMIVGVLLAFGAIGIGWSKVQWLVAAISLGLGFGLQEIFANFVSGLILLLERPIRVGDLVTVGNVTGRVTRIRIRATMIQDWDRKELVVPNREFVTSQFVNWTLSDPVVRWVFPVGIAYGSDTEKALRILERVATESPHVLKDPKPEAVFIGFGDSTLNLNLRLFVDMGKLDWRWMTDIYQRIDNAFREAGISIAFPQRDVNLRLPEPVLELLRRFEPRPEAVS